MRIEVNAINIENYSTGFLKGHSSYKSMWFTMLFVIFIIPREICNMECDMQYGNFSTCVLFFKFPINDHISKFNKIM